jgi:putative intracellular protease/amidase
MSMTTQTPTLRALFVITSRENGAWFSEITHPYWALAERGVQIDFASPGGGKVGWTAYSDPYSEVSEEPRDLVSKGFLSDSALTNKLRDTVVLSEVNLDQYDAVHFAGGAGATFDFYPSQAVTEVLEHFWDRHKPIGCLCHGAVALANIPERVRGHRVTGYSLEGDLALEASRPSSFSVANHPQTVLQDTGAEYTATEWRQPRVVVDGKLVTGQNQQSATEYGLALWHVVHGHSHTTKR